MKALLQNLKRRNYNAIYFDSKEEAKQHLLSQFKENQSIAWGGSMTINELEIKELLHSTGMEVLDRDNAKSPEEKREIHLASFDCDHYLMSSNAITEDGLLVNIDALGNRVANLIFGAKSVHIIVGKNKICKTEQEALTRARKVAPKNTKRLDFNTPCRQTGECHDCLSEQCICDHIVISRRAWVKNRVNIVVVGENLGM